MTTKEITKRQEIIDAIDELKNAFLENEEAKLAEERVKILVQKSHKRLLIAKDAVWALEH